MGVPVGPPVAGWLHPGVAVAGRHVHRHRSLGYWFCGLDVKVCFLSLVSKGAGVQGVVMFRSCFVSACVCVSLW